MPEYVDGFVLAVPKKSARRYQAQAKLAGRVWMDHGALAYRECMAEDVSWGKRTSFPRSVKAKKGEVVWLSWAVYRSKAHRNRVMAKVMADPRLAKFMKPGAMPFDPKRMYWGGFETKIKFGR